jgi:hypothetical protein
MKVCDTGQKAGLRLPVTNAAFNALHNQRGSNLAGLDQYDDDWVRFVMFYHRHEGKIPHPAATDTLKLFEYFRAGSCF